MRTSSPHSGSGCRPAVCVSLACSSSGRRVPAAKCTLRSHLVDSPAAVAVSEIRHTREQAAAATPGHGVRDSSNGADLAGLSLTPSLQSPIAEAAEADAATTANGSGSSESREAGGAPRQAAGLLSPTNDAWEPSWPTVHVSQADGADAPRDDSAAGDADLEAPVSAPPVVSSVESRADASGDGAPQARSSRGGIASGFAAQHAAQSAAGVALVAGEAGQARRPDDRGNADSGDAPPVVGTAVTGSSAESNVAVGTETTAGAGMPAQ